MIAIVDYKAGNLTSVFLALREIGEEAVITSDADLIQKADRLIFPGVGAARSSMENIEELGLLPVLKAYKATGKPFLGICLGAQIILDSSLENDHTQCVGLLPGTTGKFRSSQSVPLKIPQIGWNQVHFDVAHPVFEGIPNNSEFYFVHSYYPEPAKDDCKYASTTYGETSFTSVLGKDNLIASQFHPEKSGRWGLSLLKNFCKWNGAFNHGGATC